MTRTFAPTPSPAATAPGPVRTRGPLRATAVFRLRLDHTAVRQERDTIGDDHGHPAEDPADRPTAPRTLAHAGRTTVGPLLASGGAHFPARRSAAPGTRP
ncbi:hypothetical protein ACF06L_37730 [Streptomyces sp. NPDC015408]|uniref:hypothetical protein n=1 Tax=Streptomyces sp. NPDC015408 TaxID=3364956 RepID=UPI0036FDBCE6